MVTSRNRGRLSACQMSAYKIGMHNHVENILTGGFKHAD